MTGAIVNRDYIDPREILENIKNTVIERIHYVMTEHGSVKLNTMLNGEFIAGDKIVVKTIATKNYKLFPTYNLNEWYTRQVVDTILASLEGFQKRDSGWIVTYLKFNY